MINPEKLLAVKQLNLTGRIEELNGAKLDRYSSLLKAFIDDVPELEESLKAAIEAKEYVKYSQCLATIWNRLAKIRAVDLASACLKQTEALNEMTRTMCVDHDALATEMSYFISALSTLSIDIQMAIFRDESARETNDETPEASATSAEAENAVNPEDKIILAVDDSPFFLTLLKNCLSQLPYRQNFVTSGPTAMRFLEKHTPSLFILDILMPGMDGFELTKLIKDSGFTAPVIFLTGNASKENIQKAIDVGAADFLVKPINYELVLSKVEEYI